MSYIVNIYNLFTPAIVGCQLKKRMNKRLLVLFLIAIILGGGVFWWQRTYPAFAPTTPPVVIEPAKYVTDVDPDISHWQAKEAELFTIKFPKEWYWLELSSEKTEYRNMHVISNNPSFPLENYKNDPISLTGIQNFTLTNSEVVINFGGTATTDSGTPIDSLNFFTDSVGGNSEKICSKPTNTKTLPLIASCIHKEDDQVIQTYYIINEEISLFLNVHMSHETILPKNILEKIVKNVKLK